MGGLGFGTAGGLARQEAGCQPWRLRHLVVAMQRTKGRAWTFMALWRGERQRDKTEKRQTAREMEDGRTFVRLLLCQHEATLLHTSTAVLVMI